MFSKSLFIEQHLKKKLITCSYLYLVIPEGYSFVCMLHHFQCFIQCFTLCIYLSLHVFYLAESVHIFWNFSDEFGSLWTVEWWRNMESCRGGKVVQCYLSPSGDVVTAGCSVDQMIVIFYIYVGKKCRGKVMLCYKPCILCFI